MTNSVTQSDTYDAWVERMAAGREGKPLSAGEAVEPGKPQSYALVEFSQVASKFFHGEIGKRGDDYIFHFFPRAPYAPEKSGEFEEKMGDVFLSVFKNPNQIQAVWTDELKSWAVKVSGFVNTVWGDDQALSIFEKLDAALSK